ncbi:hypothetical protein RhiirB3_509960 [Rhizophagus irregularis]|nr:hypothetical protein RhiirB3_509960 [Rhizophagus irregularis]
MIDIEIRDIYYTLAALSVELIQMIHSDLPRPSSTAFRAAFRKIMYGSSVENLASLFGQMVERYLREHPTPTSTEEVQNWFNGLMMELPSFKRKLLVESTHNDPYLDGFKPRLSVFLEDDAHIPMLVQMLLSVKKRKSESGFADEDKGQLIDYMNILIQQQPLREDFALFLSDGSNFYIMSYEGKSIPVASCSTAHLPIEAYHNLPKINPNDTLASKAWVIIEFWDDSVNIKLDGPLWKEMDIDELFATFYNNYIEAVDNAMTKNFASCALGALLKDNELRFRVVRCNYGSFIRETICLIEAHCTEKI